MTEKFVRIGGVRVQKIDQQKFGRWTTIGPKFLIGHVTFVVVKCDCGTIAVKLYRNIKILASSSCGCFQKEAAAKRKRIHGHAVRNEMTDVYHIWSCMNQRCSNPNNEGYHKYGGRGIRVCDQWQHDFQRFIADMGPRPSPDHSLDRFPDLNGNYEPGNVRWATHRQQNNNRRDTIMIALQGRTQSIQDWAREIGIVSGNTAWQRMRKGWSADAALKTPSKTMRNGKSLNKASLRK